ncbi:hypothetical protein N9057_05070, partial [Akkermansiaceae bacterium]|nr:hypothetical protein [Akkermansiaceae bacterium]
MAVFLRKETATSFLIICIQREKSGYPLALISSGRRALLSKRYYAPTTLGPLQCPLHVKGHLLR